jgi:hypothetical protein
VISKHFVTFESPGTFVNEETTQPIDFWDVDTAVKMSRKITERYEAKPFAFYFTTRARKDSELDSKVIKESGRYFLGGRVLTLADVEREMPKEAILIANMRCNKWDRVVLNDNSWRSCQPLRAKDTVLEYAITP